MKALGRVLAATILAGVLAGCPHDKPPPATGNQAGSAELLKKDCDNPKWKEQNLGLWYSVCRQPLRW